MPLAVHLLKNLKLPVLVVQHQPAVHQQQWRLLHHQLED
jgi:hypothetical protein